MSITSATEFSPSTADRHVALWLFGCCAMIVIMVLLGGLTRLTDSGLSMVDWRPIRGWLPPLSTEQWEATFQAYRQYPEFQKQNSDMDLAGFKSIFWLEYLHRVWGRLIGLAFALPLLWFVLRRQIQAAMLPRLLAMFVLGAMQGVLGWYMVMSGLIERPDVSQYRLSAHLLFAFALYGYVLWVALGLAHRPQLEATAGSKPLALVVLALLMFVIGSGGFVAGLDAGLAYNTFPKMGEHWIPPEIVLMEPWWRNLLDNMVAVQFVHRCMAIATGLILLAYWWRQRSTSDIRAMAALAMIIVVAVQIVLGIATLLMKVPVPLAAAHQINALALFSVALFNLHVHVRGVPRA